MTLPLPQLQGLLLDMLSTFRAVAPASIAALDAADWEQIMIMVRQHRLGPMLHWRLTKDRRELPIPEAVSAKLAANFKKSAIRALVMQREMLLTHRILDSAAIPYVGLKGAYLAFHAYPHPALRPLRDLDILVPKEMALQAYRVLLEGGLVRLPNAMGDVEASSQVSQHLPPLRSQSGKAQIELHNRLFRPGSDALTDLSEDPQLWQRVIRRDIAGESIAFLSTTDLLLHLIVHAVYDHQFDNGPLILSDLACLLDTHRIDWPLFWRLAEARGLTRGCQLALGMTERYFGAQPIDWSGSVRIEATSLEAALAAASLLTLRNAESGIFVNLFSVPDPRAGYLAKLRAMLNNAFLSRTELAARYPVAADSPWIYIYYPVRWWQLATKRVPMFLRSRQGSRFADEVHRLNSLKQWLQV